MKKWLPLAGVFVLSISLLSARTYAATGEQVTAQLCNGQTETWEVIPVSEHTIEEKYISARCGSCGASASGYIDICTTCGAEGGGVSHPVNFNGQSYIHGSMSVVKSSISHKTAYRNKTTGSTSSSQYHCSVCGFDYAYVSTSAKHYYHNGYGYTGTSSTFTVYPFELDITNLSTPTYTLSKGTDTTSYKAMSGTRVTVSFANISSTQIIKVSHNKSITELAPGQSTYSFSIGSSDNNIYEFTTDKKPQTVSVNTAVSTIYNKLSFSLGATVS